MRRPKILFALFRSKEMGRREGSKRTVIHVVHIGPLPASPSWTWNSRKVAGRKIKSKLQRQRELLSNSPCRGTISARIIMEAWSSWADEWASVRRQLASSQTRSRDKSTGHLEGQRQQTRLSCLLGERREEELEFKHSPENVEVQYYGIWIF